jgi:hypothetical protein
MEVHAIARQNRVLTSACILRSNLFQFEISSRMEDNAMRRMLSWGLPLYAAILTGIFVAKGLTDNNLQAEGDVGRSANVVAAAQTPESSTPPRANGNQGSYPIPAPLAQPKHLFHFVIRYEGDGLSDPSMLAKAMAAAVQNQDDEPKKAGKSKVAKSGVPDMFQFIIRYEGDGIVDDNVAKLLKAYFAAERSENAPPTPAPATSCFPAPATSSFPAAAPSSGAPAPATPVH